MSWLAVADHKERRFSLRGLGEHRADRRRHPDDPDYVLERGTLMFETRLSPDGGPQVLLAFSHSWPGQRSLGFQAIPGGGMSMVQVNGETIAHAAATHSVPARTDVLRITFSWNGTTAGRLTVERPEEDQVTSVPVPDVTPLRLQDLRDMLLGRGDQTFAGDVIYAALSDEVEPTGPAPGLSPEAMIATPDGFHRVDSLDRGDCVISRNGDVVPVLHRITRVVPARGSFAPVRLRAPYFGLQEDVIVAPEQRLVIDGHEVEYLFSEEAVLIPARHLMNGFAALPVQRTPLQRYTQLILPAHESLLVAGTAMESLCIGRIRRHPDRLSHTLLAGIKRQDLPEHARPAHKVLKWFEAIHLARQRAA